MEMRIIVRITRHITLSPDTLCTAPTAANHEPTQSRKWLCQRSRTSAANHETKQSRQWLRKRSRNVANASSLTRWPHCCNDRQSSRARGCVNDPAAWRTPPRARGCVTRWPPSGCESRDKAVAPVAASAIPAAWRTGPRVRGCVTRWPHCCTDPALWRPPPARRLPPMCKLRAERSVWGNSCK